MPSDTPKVLEASMTSHSGDSTDEQSSTQQYQQQQDSPATIELAQDSSRTPLMLAVISGDISTLHTLIEEQAELRKQDADGLTALMHAAKGGCLEAAELLVEHEWGIQDINGMTALMHAVQAKSTDVIGCLAVYEGEMMDGEGRTATDIALGMNDAEVINFLLAAMES